MQHKWASKLLDYDFVVEYKKRSENQAANALSQREQVGEETLMLISFLTVDWLEDLTTAYSADPKVQGLISLFKDSKLGSEYTMRSNLILYNQRLYIPQNAEFKARLFELEHSSPWGVTWVLTRIFKE